MTHKCHSLNPMLLYSVYGDEVAFKSADVFKQAELSKQMEHEVSVLGEFVE